MMKYTDRHYRFFMRAITKYTQLYTEMVCASTIVRGKPERSLIFNENEHPVVLQLGGDDPHMLYDAVQIAESFNYDEYNLNVGCPSEKVQSGNFGACLMASPPKVCELLESMQRATNKPVSIKHRIGIMNKGEHRHTNQYGDLYNFVDVVRQSGVQRFIVHARIAILGLKPKENRNIPPLCYNDVYRLQDDFPALSIELNGGVKTLSEAKEHGRYCAGVMIGRAAWDNPYLFAEADSWFFNRGGEIPQRSSIVSAMIEYLKTVQNQQKQVAARQVAARQVAARQATSRHYILRHMVHLFAHYPGSSRWRQLISANPTDSMLIDCAQELESSLTRMQPALAQ